MPARFGLCVVSAPPTPVFGGSLPVMLHHMSAELRFDGGDDSLNGVLEGIPAGRLIGTCLDGH
jgi:hypothetical protein